MNIPQHTDSESGDCETRPHFPPVDDDEIVYRKIWKADITRDGVYPLGYNGFRPSSSDKEGISVARASFHSPSAVARFLCNPSKPGEYFLMSLRVNKLRSLKPEGFSQTIRVEESPVCRTQFCGHAHLPDLHHGMKPDKRRKLGQQALASAVEGTEWIGPFVIGEFASPSDLLKSKQTESELDVSHRELPCGARQ